MSEYGCMYRKALTIFVKPDSPIKPNKKEMFPPTPIFSQPSLGKESIQTERDNKN